MVEKVKLNWMTWVVLEFWAGKRLGCFNQCGVIIGVKLRIWTMDFTQFVKDVLK